MPISINVLVGSLALLVLELDSNVDISMHDGFTWLNPMQAQSAKQIVNIIATSSITITTIVFSITLVVLTMASQQFGPRLIENFTQDKRSQSVLGWFTSVFVYCIIVLRSISAQPDATFVPTLSINFAILLGLVNIIVLIYFIHHVARSIRADNVVERITRSLNDNLNLTKSVAVITAQNGNAFVSRQDDINWFKVSSLVTGYIQAIDYTKIVGRAAELDCQIQVHFTVGDALVGGSTLISVDRHLDTRSLAYLRNCFFINGKRKSLQAPLFSVRQLVEIALRALSPAMNDPFTAKACVNSLVGGLYEASNLSLGQQLLLCDEGIVRVVASWPNYSDLLNHSLSDIVTNSLDQPSVVAFTIQQLKQLRINLKNQPHQDCVDSYLDELMSNTKIIDCLERTNSL